MTDKLHTITLRAVDSDGNVRCLGTDGDGNDMYNIKIRTICEKAKAEEQAEEYRKSLADTFGDKFVTAEITSADWD